jgi:putative membrane protein
MPGNGGLNKQNLMKTKLISCFTVILCVAVTALAATKSTPAKDPNVAKLQIVSKMTAKDKAFAINAAKGGQMEVAWGKLAARHGQSRDVKNFGNKMVADHTQANNELNGLAMEERLKLPKSKSSGKWKSDKDYINMMVKDHEQDLAEFQNEAQNGTDPDVKKFADKYSKVVQGHLDIAKGIQRKLK